MRRSRNFTPRVTISRYVFAVQCAPRSAVRISSFLFHECTYARMFLHAAYRPTFLSYRAAFKKLHFIRASLLVIRFIMSSSFVFFFFLFSFFLLFPPIRARAHIPARSISETWLKRMGWQRSNIPKLIDGIFNDYARWRKIIIIARSDRIMRLAADRNVFVLHSCRFLWILYGLSCAPKWASSTYKTLRVEEHLSSNWKGRLLEVYDVSIDPSWSRI